MSPDPENKPREAERASSDDEIQPAAGASWRGWFALQDLVPIAYLLIYRLMVWASPAGPLNDASAYDLNLALAVVVGGCTVCRGATILPAKLRGLLYRVMLGYIAVANYLMLRDLLALVSPHSLDAMLVDIDTAMFGVVPALWLERLNHRPIVEWFSFFYFSYFWICATYLVVVLGTVRDKRAKTEFTLGCFIVLSVGQLLYSQVPGFGPITHMEAQFAGPVNGGRFWGYVWDTVQAGSAMKDIFPSIHTAMPTWITFFAWRQARRDPRWKWPARVTTFAAANIVFSTVFLRWHYVIDVFAGLTLAGAVTIISPKLTAWEARWREKRGLKGVWGF